MSIPSWLQGLSWQQCETLTHDEEHPLMGEILSPEPCARSRQGTPAQAAQLTQQKPAPQLEVLKRR